MADIKTRGKNIKIFDKIKLQHVQTMFRIHSLNHEWRNGSYNQAVGCHKARDQTDWFIVLKAEVEQNKRSNLSYHFQYGDKILLSNVSAKKYLHVTQDFPSEASKNLEVSLCNNGEGTQGCLEDQWEIVQTATTSDSYWRVGETIKLKNVHFDNFLCSHNRKLRQSGDNEVFVRGKETEDKKKTEFEMSLEQQWIVSQIQPFIYSANLTDKKPAKKTEQSEQIQNLRKMKSQISMPTKQINQNSTQDLLKIGNQRLAQIQNQKKKQAQYEKQMPFYKKIFMCGFCCPKQNDYHSFN